MARRGCTRCGPRRRCGRPTSGGSTRRSARSSPRRSSGAARRSTTTPRPTATARCRSASTSTSGPASRARAAAGRSSGSSSARARRTSARGASACRRPTGRARARSCATISGGDVRRGPALDRARGGGEPRADAGRGRARRGPRPDRADEAGGRDPAGGGPGLGRRAAADVDPAARGRHPRGRHVRDPRRDRGAPSRSATGSAWSARTAPARRRCCASRPGATSRTAARSSRKRGLSIGLLAQEAHFDAAFMAAPDLRTAVRTGAAHLDAMADRARGARARRTGRRAGLRGPPAPVRGARRLHAGPARRRGAERPRLHAATSGSEPPTGAVGRRADAGRAGPARHRRSGPAAPRRADQPPRPRRARVARGAPPPADRLARSSRRTTAPSSTRP